MTRLLLLLMLACTTAFAAEPTLVVPQFEKKPGEPVEGDSLQAKYDAAWATYAEAIGNATAAVTKALDAQFEKAADAGNLELADMWDKKKKVFLDTRTLEWASDGKAKAEWRKTNPKVDYPDDFSEVVASAQQAYAAAVDALKADCEALVKDYTKARNLERAKQVREEMAVLDKKPVAPPQRPRMVEERPEAKRRGPQNGRDLQRLLVGTRWKNQNGFTFEWDINGALWHCKDGGRAPIQVEYLSGNKCTVLFINNARQTFRFNEDFSEFQQLGADGTLLQSAIRLK